MATPARGNGRQVFERLQQRVDSPEFLAKLQELRSTSISAPAPGPGGASSMASTAASMASSSSSSSSAPPQAATDEATTRVLDRDGFEVNVNLDDPSWWLWVTDADSYGLAGKEAADEWGGESYVVVDKEDVIDAIANFVARYVSTLPQTKNLQPKELQDAMAQAFTELRRKSTLRRFWDWGRFLYTSAYWATTAFGIYKNPIVIRATLVAIWTSSRIILGLLR
eukprot:SM000028S10096  [mRNA]  locus=s28:387970:389372:- [translate_table: standard]